MFRPFTQHRDYEPAIDAGEDRDLVAAMNEARNPEDLERLTAVARQRRRARSHEAGASRRRAHSRRTGLSLGRALGLRH